jgi:hypothetical protein
MSLVISCPHCGIDVSACLLFCLLALIISLYRAEGPLRGLLKSKWGIEETHQPLGAWREREWNCGPQAARRHGLQPSLPSFLLPRKLPWPFQTCTSSPVTWQVKFHQHPSEGRQQLPMAELPVVTTLADCFDPNPIQLTGLNPWDLHREFLL